MSRIAQKLEFVPMKAIAVVRGDVDQRDRNRDPEHRCGVKPGEDDLSIPKLVSG
jgi:hypothetical protein